MGVLTDLGRACFPEDYAQFSAAAEQQIMLWQRWLLPIHANNPVGEDPSYDDEFERIREEVGKLSGADVDLIIDLSENLLTSRCKDLRVVTYYIWARLHKEGEAGLADSLGLLAGLCQRYGEALLPLRPSTRKAAIEWLGSSRILDSLSLYPEVGLPEFRRIVAALLHVRQSLESWDKDGQPELAALHQGLEKRLAQSGGAQALIPQTMGSTPEASKGRHSEQRSATGNALQPIQSGRELLGQAKALAGYLRQQNQGWLAGHRLMKSVRWDTIHQVPPQNNQGCTRLEPPRSEARAQLKRLYVQQNWNELLEQADRLFSEGVNHLWLDVQWYLYQALTKAGAPWDAWSVIIKQDLQQLLNRLPGLEQLAWSDGSPFADEVTREWINREVLEQGIASLTDLNSNMYAVEHDDILSLEQEALAHADTEGLESAIAWLQSRPNVHGLRQQWFLRLLMARLAEQFARNEMALNLLQELDAQAQQMTLQAWEPSYVFEIKARQLQLLRAKALRSGADKAGLTQQMDQLLSGLTQLDPVRALVLYQ